MKAALVVIDLQHDFLPPKGALAVAEGDKVIPRIIQLLNPNLPWLAVVATQDWHPHNHALFASQHGVEPFSEIEFAHPLGEKNCQTGEVKKRSNVVWPPHCVQNTPGAELEETFCNAFRKVGVPKVVIRKGLLQDREYYLCFTDTWKLHKTGMEQFLLEHGITDVVFVGLAYDYCVLNSAVDSLLSGFTTYVVRNCCKSVNPENEAQVELQLQQAGVHVVRNSDDLLHKMGVHYA